MSKIEVLYIQKDFFINANMQKIIADNFANEWNASYAYNEFDAHKVIEANALPFDVVIIDDKKEEIANWRLYANHLSSNEKCKESIVIVHSTQSFSEDIGTLKFQSFNMDEQNDKIKENLNKLFEQINTDIHYPQHKRKHTITKNAVDTDFLPEFIGKSKPVGKLRYEIDECINDNNNSNTIIKQNPIPMLIIGGTGNGKSLLLKEIEKYYKSINGEDKKTKIIPCKNNNKAFKTNLDKLDALKDCTFFAFDDIDDLHKEEQKGLADWIAKKNKNTPETVVICTASNDDDKIENNLRYHLEKIKIPPLKERIDDVKDIENIINSFRSDGDKIAENDIKIYIESNKNKKFEWENNCYHLCHFAKTFQGNIYKWIKEHTL